jgi:hypothetical protein
MTDFFKSMAQIAPVYVTLGNHDGILSNASRLDAITPIISAIGSSARHPITLCKKSGVYPMHVSGYNLCVFSCFDEEGWDNVKPVPGDINIAAFHGGIAGCLLDSDMEYQADTTIDLFDGFDVALLGDIHRMQFLSFKQVRMLVAAEKLHEYPGANVLGSKSGLLEIEAPVPQPTEPRADAPPTALHAVVARGDVELAARLLSRPAAFPVHALCDWRGRRCTTPLHLACERGDLRMAQLLLAHGAFADWSGASGRAGGVTPLALAAVNDDFCDCADGSDAW